jgi:integrase/recombinase XerD
VAAVSAGRSSGPLLRDYNQKPLDRHDAARIVRRLARRAGLPPTNPHALRHAFVTAALDTGAPLRDVQDAAGHADPRTTRRYDRTRYNLDRHPTYAVATHFTR